MSLELMTKARPRQIAHLRSLMQQADAEWEELTRSIQVEQELLTVLKRYLEHCHWALALENQQPGSSPSSLAMQAGALEQQMARMEQHMTLENARRDTLTQQFEQDRLALSVLRKSTHRRRRYHTARFRGILRRCAKQLLHGLWLLLLHAANWCMVIPGDLYTDYRS